MSKTNDSHYIVNRSMAGRFILSRVTGYDDEGQRKLSRIGPAFKSSKSAIQHGRLLAGWRGIVEASL